MADTKPTTRDAERTKDAILNAATQLFAAHGFDGASIGGIADLAGVSRATPVFFFTNKDGLWRAVLDRANRDALEVAPRAFARLGAATDPTQIIESLVDAFLEFIDAHPHFFRLVQWSELQRNAAINELPSQWDAIASAIETVTTLLHGQGQSEDARQVVMSIIAVCTAHVVFGQTLGTPLGVDVRSPEFLNARAVHLKRLIVAALT